MFYGNPEVDKLIDEAVAAREKAARLIVDDAPDVVFGKRLEVTLDTWRTGRARWPSPGPPLTAAGRARVGYRSASERRRGSSSSRRASPTRLAATTVSMMQKPGTQEIHQARRR